MNLIYEDNNNEDVEDKIRDDNSGAEEFVGMKGLLFEKVLTLSDVGKLNRLVIPKQHAEKYFPLSGNNNNEGEKDLVLSFWDELGKAWRFRYSYWNSSQSYVLTKGWSRFVKEKKLEAADIVFFQRHRFDVDRFFIVGEEERILQYRTISSFHNTLLILFMQGMKEQIKNCEVVWGEHGLPDDR